MHLGRIQPLVVALHPILRLVECAQSLVDLSEGAVCVGEKRQIPRPHRTHSKCPTTINRFTDVVDACDDITLLGAGPSAGKQTPEGHRGRPTLERYLQRLVGESPRGLRLTTKLSQLRREQEHYADAVGMLQLPRVCKRPVHGQHRLSRITQHPVGERVEVPADDPWILVVGGDTREVLVGVVELQAPATVFTDVDDIALPPGGVRNHPMSCSQHQRTVFWFGELQKLVCQCARFTHLPAQNIRVGQAGKRREIVPTCPRSGAQAHRHERGCARLSEGRS